MPHHPPTESSDPPSEAIFTALTLRPAFTRPRLTLPISIAVSAAIALLAAYAIACIRFARPGSDPSWLLYAAGRVLDGATLYGPHITESNPPLIVWFSLLPVLFARWLHASPVLVLKVLVTAMAFASAAWCVRILHAARLVVSPLQRCLGLCAIVAAEVSRDLLPVGQFSQREQLVIILTLPYLLYAASRSQRNHIRSLGCPERIALGCAAGLGICLKPQQVLLLLSFKLFLLLWTLDLRRLLRAEILAAALTIAAYVLIVYFATPYFSQMAPLLKDTYWAFADTPRLTLARSAFLNIKFLLALFLCLAARRYLMYPAAPLALLAASLGAGAAYVAQGTGWSYHLFPATVLLLCAVGWIALDLLSNLPATTAFQTISLVAITLILIAVALPAFLARERRQIALQAKYRSDISLQLAQYPPQTPVYVFSTSLGEFSDILQDHLVWTGRYNHLWLLPAIVEDERALAGGTPARKSISPNRLRELATKLRSDTAADLRLGKPTIVIVEHCGPGVPCQALGDAPFDFIPWFLQSPNFAAEWSNYRLQSTTTAFDVYRRIP